MLKFFRKYNKIILAAGGSVLMVVFLIEPAMQMFYRTEADMPVGTLAGDTVTRGETHQAQMELRLLQQIPVVGQLANRLGQNDGLRWMLMRHEAQQLGISASQAEVEGVLETLAQVGAFTEEDMRELMNRHHVPAESIHAAIRTWLALERYHDLVLGQEPISALSRLELVMQAMIIEQQAMAQMQQAQDQGDMMQMFQIQQQAQMQAQTLVQMALGGNRRLSEPLIQHLLVDQYAQVEGELALVDAGLYRDQVEPPDEAALEELFEQYRDVPAGEGEPYGFGYQLPDRVRLEYLAVDIAAVRDAIEIEEADALAYYEQNQEEFAEPVEDEQTGEQTEQVPPYREVRRDVHERLRDQEARQLAGRIISRAESILERQVRRLPEDRGYRVLGEDFEPMSFDELAAELEDEFDVPVEVHTYTDEWVGLEELAQLPGIGEAELPGEAGDIVDYVSSLRELDPGDDHPLRAYALQVDVPGRALSRPWDGSQYLFRVREAEGSRPPESLDEVREQVEADALTKRAYEALQRDSEQWLSRARAAGLADLADEEGLELSPLMPTPRRQMGPDGRLQPAEIEGVGRSEALIAAMFSLAEELSEHGERDLGDIDASERLGVVGVPGRQVLALFRVDGYYPMTEQQFREQVAGPMAAVQVNQVLQAHDFEAELLSTEALARRVDFVAEDPDELEEPEAPAEQQPQRRPGQI